MEVDESLMFAVTWGSTLQVVVSGANPGVTSGWVVTLVEPLCDGDGKVGEVDILVLGASPSSVAT